MRGGLDISIFGWHTGWAADGRRCIVLPATAPGLHISITFLPAQQTQAFGNSFVVYSRDRKDEKRS